MSRAASPPSTWSAIASARTQIIAPDCYTKARGGAPPVRLSLDDPPRDRESADARPLSRSVAGEEIDGRVHELGVLQQIPLRIRSRVSGNAFDHELACLGRGRQARRVGGDYHRIAPLGGLTHAAKHGV